MNADALAAIDAIIEQALKARAALSDTGIVFVPAGGDLQKALDAGGAIEFEGTHEGSFVAYVPGTRLVGRAGATLRGLSASALIVPPGAFDIQLSAFSATGASDQAVIRLGANDDTQTNPTQEPHSLTLRGIRIPTHRGKRGFEINARNVLLEDCDVRDLWDPALRDSQAIGLLNSSGSLTVRRGHFEAGSEIILTGGDSMKMAGVVPKDLLFEDLELARPLAWRTDGIKRVVKNCFELKTGHNVTLRKSKLSGSWRDGQTGNAIVLTPTRDGQLTNVVIEDCVISDVGSGLQILGRSYSYHTPSRLTLLYQRNKLTTDHVTYGGNGWLAASSGEPEALIFRQNDATLTGTTFFSYQFGKVMEADGSVRQGGPLGTLEITGNRATCPRYGIALDGFKADGNVTAYVNGGPNKEGFASVGLMDVFDNTFTGGIASSVMKRNFPRNVYE